MACAVCKSLNHEYDDLCSQEAKLTLVARGAASEAPVTDNNEGVLIEDRILAVRKRQARVMFELGDHQLKAHSA